MSSDKIVVFDLDGTLADTAPDLVGTLNRIIAPSGLQPVQISEVGQIVGHGARAMIKKAFELQQHPLSMERLDNLFGEFLEDYVANIANETRLFPGLLDALEKLEQSGFGFSICTNKMEAPARLLLKKLDVLERFRSVTGGDTFPFKKPDPNHILETIKMAGGKPDNSIMIGDSINDIAAAKSANVSSIVVTFGYSDIPVETLGATRSIDTFSVLAETIAEIESAK